MADRTITVDVQSNLREQTQEARNLNRELDRAGTQRSTSRTGSRAADAALGASGGGTTGMTRGASGAGGRGDTRDFARQAQDLGGLVHIYATFAANVYAVTAAFNALSKAQDTSNMITAAKELSAVYGVSLSNVAKQLSAITDGAISAKEALQFATMGASAGLNTKQMSELSKVAKGASLALGRDLADSMQRIYKGAIKVEPELLDELGIMVKLDQATSDYARTIGKTSSSLTDYERRQAYVNAVIKEGSDKFGELADKSSNPYSKLLAQSQNVLTTMGMVINKGLAPIVELLSQSPMGLAAAILGVVGILTKMAVPSLNTFIEKQHALATASSTAAAKLAADSRTAAQASEASFNKINAGIQSVIDEKQFKGKAKQSAALKSAISAGRELSDAIVEGFDSGAGIQVSEKLKNLKDKYVTAANAAIKDAQSKLAKAAPGSTQEQAQQQIIAHYSKRVQYAQDLEKNAKALNLAEAENLRFKRESEAAEKRANDQRFKAHTLQVLQNKGLKEALSLVSETTKKRVERSDTTWDKAKAGIGGIQQSASLISTYLTQAAGKVLNFIGLWGTVASVVIEFGSAALHSFGIITDEGKKASESAESLSNTLKTVKDSVDKLATATTLDSIFRLETATLDGLVNAQKEFSDLVDKYERFTATASTGAKFWDATFGSTTSDTATAAGQSLDVLQASGKVSKTQLSKIVEEATGITGQIGMNWETTLQQMGRSSLDFQGNLRRLKAGLADVGKELEKQALANHNIDSGLKDLSKASTDYIQALIPLNNLSKTAAAFATTLGGLFGNLTSANVAKVAGGITPEVAYMAGTGLPDEITQASKALKGFEQVINNEIKTSTLRGKDLEKFKEEQKARLTAYTDEIFGVGSPAFQSLIGFSMNVGEQFQVLAKQASESSVALASIGQKIRSLSFVESVTGPNAAIVKERQRLEDQQRAEQAKVLTTTRDQLQAILKDVDTEIKSTLQSIGSTEGTTPSMAIKEIISRPAEKITEKDKAALQVLLNLKDQQINKTAALTEAQAKLDVLTLSADTAAVRSAQVRNQAGQDQLELLKARNQAETVYLDIRLRDLDLLSKSMPYAQEELAVLKEKITYQKDLAKLKYDEEVINENIRKQQDIMEANPDVNSAAYKAAKAAKDRLEIEQKSIQANKDGLTILAEGNIKLAERAALLAEVNKKLEISNLYMQASTTLGESNKVTTSQQLVYLKEASKYAEEQYNLQVQLSNLAITKAQNDISEAKTKTESLTAQLAFAKDDADKTRLNTELIAQQIILKTSGLEITKQEAAIALKSAQEQLRKEKEITEQRSLRMKSFEETGKGSLSDYGSDIFNYAKEKWANERKQAKSIGETFVDSMGSGIDTISAGLSEMLQKSEFSWKSLGDLVRNTFSNIFRDLAADLMKMAIKIALIGSGGGGSGGWGGLIGLGISALGSYFGGAPVATDAASAATIYGTTAGSVQNSILLAQDLAFKAKGGIVGPMGDIRLKQYATGGIADSPQLAVFGEGSKNEAYVPLPDNRSIPVTLTGGGGSNVSIGDTYINVKVDSAGNASTDAKTSTEMAKMLSIAIKKTVQEEFIKQARPGGMLYGK